MTNIKLSRLYLQISLYSLILCPVGITNYKFDSIICANIYYFLCIAVSIGSGLWSIRCEIKYPNEKAWMYWAIIAANLGLIGIGIILSYINYLFLTGRGPPMGK